MAQVIYTDEALADLERLFEFIADSDPAAAVEAVQAIREAIEILDRHPLVGRPVEYGLRELVISYGKRGYMALYDFIEADDAVLVLALRHQREARYPRQ